MFFEHLQQSEVVLAYKFQFEQTELCIKAKTKVYSYSSIFLVILISSCRFEYRIEPKKIDGEKISNTISSKQNSEKQHICYQELNSALSAILCK